MTIADYINSAPVTGGITDGCNAVTMLNAARELLWPLDDFAGTVEYGCVNATGTFYLPSHIETVRKTWACNQSVPINNENWLYVEAGSLSDLCGIPVSVVRTDKHVVLPVDFPSHAQIGFTAQDSGDVGKMIAVTARNVFGSIVSEQVQLPKIQETVFAEIAVKELISINKPPTDGAIAVVSRLPGCTENQYLLEAYETDIRYWQYKALNVCECLVIKGKKKFFPYKETDLYREIDIRPNGALQFASQAIEHQRSRNYSGYQQALLIARKLCERTTEDLKRTSAPGVTSSAEPSKAFSNSFYGYA